MLFGTLITALVVVVVIILTLVSMMWLGKPWFMQWLKGTAGILMLIGGVVVIYGVLDLVNYQQAANEPPALTVTTYQLEEQLFDVSLVDPDGEEQRYVLNGDQWQLDARLLRWSGPIDSLASHPLYQWDRLSGRYLSLEQQRSRELSAFSLRDNGLVDIWNMLRGAGLWLKPEMGSAVFMPLVNGATYAVWVTNDGIVSEPVNDVAEKALQGEW